MSSSKQQKLTAEELSEVEDLSDGEEEIEVTNKIKLISLIRDSEGDSERNSELRNLTKFKPDNIITLMYFVDNIKEPLDRIRVLDLSKLKTIPVTREIYIGLSKILHKLEKIDLSGTKFGINGEEGLTALLTANKTVGEINLSGTEGLYGQNLANVFTKSRDSLEFLGFVNLNGTNANDATLNSLTNLKDGVVLFVVSVEDCPVTETGKNSLRAKYPDIKVLDDELSTGRGSPGM